MYSKLSLSVALIFLVSTAFAFSDGRPCKNRTAEIINKTTHDAYIKQKSALFALYQNLPAVIPAGKKINLQLIRNPDKWNFLLGPYQGIPAIYTVTFYAKLDDKQETTLSMLATFKFPGCVLGTLNTPSTTHYRVDEKSDGQNFHFIIIDKLHTNRELSWYQRFYEWLFD